MEKSMFKLNVPEGTASTVVLMRGADHRGVHNTLSPDGIRQCQNFIGAYAQLLAELQNIIRFPEPLAVMYYTSDAIQELLTVFMIFAPCAIHQNPLLNHHAGFMRPDGRMDSEIIRELILDPKHQETVNIFKEDVYNYCLAVTCESRVHKIICAREPVMSIMVATINHQENLGFKDEDLGLDECEAYIIYLDQGGKPIGIQKFVPKKEERIYMSDYCM